MPPIIFSLKTPLQLDHNWVMPPFIRKNMELIEVNWQTRTKSHLLHAIVMCYNY